MVHFNNCFYGKLTKQAPCHSIQKIKIVRFNQKGAANSNFIHDVNKLCLFTKYKNYNPPKTTTVHHPVTGHGSKSDIKCQPGMPPQVNFLVGTHKTFNSHPYQFLLSHTGSLLPSVVCLAVITNQIHALWWLLRGEKYSHKKQPALHTPNN